MRPIPFIAIRILKIFNGANIQKEILNGKKEID
jgi:hypothetical protein